ncbi:duffy binding-like merozoite surface protein, partial [Plasmodium gaboni]
GIPSNNCKSLFKDYENVINSKRTEWEIFVKHFDRKKSGYIAANGSTPETYLKEKCPECDCAKINLNDIFQKEYNIQSLLKELIDPQTSESVSTNISPVVQPTGQENTEQTSVSTTQEEQQPQEEEQQPQEEEQQPQEEEQQQPQPQNIQREDNNDNILGWEFGPVADPGTNPYISSGEKNSLELINLTSWDKEDIIKQNEDVKEEFEEEQAEEELQEEIEEEQDELQEELQQEEIEEEQDELQEELQEEQDEEEDKSNKEGEQEKKTEDEKKEETIDSSDDKNAHESLSIGFNNNMEIKKDAASIVKDLFSLFKEKNTFEDLLKDLTGDLASLFQKQ